MAVGLGGGGGANPLLGLSLALAQQGATPPMGSLPDVSGGGTPFGGGGGGAQPQSGGAGPQAGAAPGAGLPGQGDAMSGLGQAAAALDRSNAGQQQQPAPAAGAGGPGGILNPQISQLLMQMMRGQGGAQMPTLGNLIAGR